ncbi:MAG: hypothetical protein V7646_7326 [Pseudonocardia sp.]
MSSPESGLPPAADARARQEGDQHADARGRERQCHRLLHGRGDDAQSHPSLAESLSVMPDQEEYLVAAAARCRRDATDRTLTAGAGAAEPLWRGHVRRRRSGGVVGGLPGHGSAGSPAVLVRDRPGHLRVPSGPQGHGDQPPPVVGRARPGPVFFIVAASVVGATAPPPTITNAGTTTPIQGSAGTPALRQSPMSSAAPAPVPDLSPAPAAPPAAVSAPATASRRVRNCSLSTRARSAGGGPTGIGSRRGSGGTGRPRAAGAARAGVRCGVGARSADRSRFSRWHRRPGPRRSPPSPR